MLTIRFSGAIGVLWLSMASFGCGDGAASPSRIAIVTLAVVDETFRVTVIGDENINDARDAQGGGRARIPNGRIVLGAVNTGWRWHLEAVEFVEAAIELCDGRPSDVERQALQFGGGRFCPWSARVLEIDVR